MQLLPQIPKIYSFYLCIYIIIIQLCYLIQFCEIYKIVFVHFLLNTDYNFAEITHIVWHAMKSFQHHHQGDMLTPPSEPKAFLHKLLHSYWQDWINSSFCSLRELQTSLNPFIYTRAFEIVYLQEYFKGLGNERLTEGTMFSLIWEKLILQVQLKLKKNPHIGYCDKISVRLTWELFFQQ